MQTKMLTLGRAHADTLRVNRELLEEHWPAAVLAAWDRARPDDLGRVSITVRAADYAGFLRDLFQLRAGEPVGYVTAGD